MSSLLTIHHGGRRRDLEIHTGRYTNGRLAVQLFDPSDQEMYATVSLNIPEEPLAEGQFIFKTYSENERLFEELLFAGAIKPVRTAHLPIGDLPICRLADSPLARS